MGSEINDDEKPIHEVDLDSYYMDIYEVTNAAYKVCADDGTCKLPDNTDRYNNLTYADHPVVYVDWNKAKTYCEWRDAKLPTEAEWEKAARSTDRRTYPWGEDISCDKANYYSCVGDTTKVGTYKNGKSPYGMYDMAGNAWELVNDWYDSVYYQNSLFSNPLGPDIGAYRVLRGGAWYDHLDYGVRSALRSRIDSSSTSDLIGFRCARSLP
jgi:formylglycine-generating enzyme required for sulfatase activity